MQGEDDDARAQILVLRLEHCRKGQASTCVLPPPFFVHTAYIYQTHCLYRLKALTSINLYKLFLNDMLLLSRPKVGMFGVCYKHKC